MAPESSDKKATSKKARTLASGDPRKEADKKAQKEVKKNASDKKSVAQERLVTVQVWARGNTNPLVRAFLSEHVNQRTVKRTNSAWITLFREWKERPRG